MSARVERQDPHVAVERDVLVRYLDAWAAGALRSQRGATYVESGGFVADVFRVFGEFADRLEDHHLEMLIAGSHDGGEPPPGLSVRVVDTPGEEKITGPMLAHLDADGPDVDKLAKGKGHELVLTVPAGEQDLRGRLRAAGLACTIDVELVADDGQAHLLVFATGDIKHLTTFKNELWAVDEFAGIRYRDPRDPERTLVDISLTPQLLPLRVALLAEVARRGSCTVAELQQHTLLETIYRPADAIAALNAAEITREPAKGRLTPRTVVRR